jgi:hypothetical protein
VGPAPDAALIKVELVLIFSAVDEENGGQQEGKENASGNSQDLGQNPDAFAVQGPEYQRQNNEQHEQGNEEDGAQLLAHHFILQNGERGYPFHFGLGWGGNGRLLTLFLLHCAPPCAPLRRSAQAGDGKKQWEIISVEVTHLHRIGANEHELRPVFADIRVHSMLKQFNCVSPIPIIQILPGPENKINRQWLTQGKFRRYFV